MVCGWVWIDVDGLQKGQPQKLDKSLQDAEKVALTFQLAHLKIKYNILCLYIDRHHIEE
jgi:hypothetical protein